MHISLQVIDLHKYQFRVLKTQGKGTKNGPIDITDKVAMPESTYIDSTKNLTITCKTGKRILVIFRSGLSFELEQHDHWSDALNIKVPQHYTFEKQSRGILGSTSVDTFEECKLCSSTFITEHGKRTDNALQSLSGFFCRENTRERQYVCKS